MSCGKGSLLAGRTGEERGKPCQGVKGKKDCINVKRKGGDSYGRKLQAEVGRWETRVKISDINRCWTLVSCEANVRRGVSGMMSGELLTSCV